MVAHERLSSARCHPAASLFSGGPSAARKFAAVLSSSRKSARHTQRTLADADLLQPCLGPSATEDPSATGHAMRPGDTPLSLLSATLQQAT
jgi:hypothetical protein